MPVRKPKTLFTMRKLLDAGIRQRKSDDYFDVTAMCMACDKDLQDYMELHKTERFHALLSKELKLDGSELVEPKNKAGEIWVHPHVALNFAQWAFE
ncbi:MAG: KilA-N domain-containing protein [Lentimicrobiaceae bacterium]|nr:KilA-N domain-containing protein [Lentimicrobiaceae bacterium]